MKLCVPLPCFFKQEDMLSSIGRIKEIGYDTVEIYNWVGLDLKALSAELKMSGVEMRSMCTSFFKLTEKEYRQSWLDGLKASCEAANTVGAKRLITQVGNDVGIGRDEQHKNIVETLSVGAEILKEYGVVLMPEPLNVLVNHPGYYLTSAKEGFDIIKEVGSPNVKLIYDIYHQQITEGNIIPTIKENLPLIAHMHAAGHPGRHEPWMGETDYKFVFKTLDELGYDGAMGLEYRPTMDPTTSLKMAREIYG